MDGWAGLLMRFLDGELSGLDAGQIRERYAWVDELADKAALTLSAEEFERMPPEEIYSRLDALNVPQCQIRMTNLGRMNQADTVFAAIKRMLSEPGDFKEKYRAGKIPQAGMTTLTQVLSVARPHRFAIRNAVMTRAIAKVTPFYTARAVDELGYEEYLDLCRELAKGMESWMDKAGLGEWARKRRFLLLYAILTSCEKK